MFSDAPDLEELNIPSESLTKKTKIKLKCKPDDQIPCLRYLSKSNEKKQNKILDAFYDRHSSSVFLPTIVYVTDLNHCTELPNINR